MHLSREVTIRDSKQYGKLRPRDEYLFPRATKSRQHKRMDPILDPRVIHAGVSRAQLAEEAKVSLQDVIKVYTPEAFKTLLVSALDLSQRVLCPQSGARGDASDCKEHAAAKKFQLYLMCTGRNDGKVIHGIRTVLREPDDAEEEALTRHAHLCTCPNKVISDVSGCKKHIFFPTVFDAGQLHDLPNRGVLCHFTMIPIHDTALNRHAFKIQFSWHA